jgi:ParB family chromosome partitioning protein
VQGILHPEQKQKGDDKVIEPLDPNVRQARDELQRSLGLKVKIEDKKGRGRVIIEYGSLEDFDTLIDVLSRQRS